MKALNQKEDFFAGKLKNTSDTSTIHNESLVQWLRYGDANCEDGGSNAAPVIHTTEHHDNFVYL